MVAFEMWRLTLLNNWPFRPIDESFENVAAEVIRAACVAVWLASSAAHARRQRDDVCWRVTATE